MLGKKGKGIAILLGKPKEGEGESADSGEDKAEAREEVKAAFMESQDPQLSDDDRVDAFMTAVDMAQSFLSAFPDDEDDE